METVKVLDSFNEAKNIKTIRFNFDGEARPGQFVMVWLPGIDEIPMSLSYLDGPKGITAEDVGVATQEIHKLQPGDLIGIRGPYGNSFDLSGDDFLVVGGGTGMAPLAPALEALTASGKHVTCLIGARSRSHLLFMKRVSSSDAKVEAATDDGSAGHHGFVTELARKYLEKGSFSNILTCGPEPMLAAMVEMA
ncbi:MAG: dihydroorotate dehydrogenase electron transfer subunit, partial [Thermoplasmata archaeon]|nr:dihydroorotate dehydrogenase electron transfer subunit [Thermoplasmata archaeon]